MTNNIQEIAAAYEAATQEFLLIATSVPADKLDLNDGENWSSRQVIHHCADSEAQSYARLRRLVAEPNPVIQGYDENLWAKDATLGYTELPIENSIAVFASVRVGWRPIPAMPIITQIKSSKTWPRSSPQEITSLSHP